MANDPNQNPTAEDIANIAHSGASVYSTGASWIGEALFARAYKEALAMGLEGTAATQQANAAAESTFTASGASVGKWLPWIGAGLIIYDWATGDITVDSTITSASLLTGALVHPAFFVPAAMNISVAMFKSHNRKSEDIVVDVYTPDLELKYTDEDNNYYLEASPGVWIRYNPETNILETYARNSKGGHDHADFDELQKAEWGKFTGEVPQWSEEEGYAPESWYVAGRMWDLAALQVQIYNQVLLPEGLAPRPNAEPINVDGKKCYRDDSGIVYNAGGYILGHYDEESNQVLSFRLQGDPDRDMARPRLNVDNIDTSTLDYGVMGTVRDSPAYLPGDDIPITGLPSSITPSASSIDLTWSFGATADEPDYATGFHLYNKEAANDYFDKRNQDRVASVQNDPYRIDTQTGNLYYGDTVIGHTDITDANYSGTCAGFPTYNTDGRVRDAEGNLLGHVTVDLGTGRMSMHMSPSNSEEALKIYQGSEGYGYEGRDADNYKNSLEYSYASIPDYPEGTMGQAKMPGSQIGRTADVDVLLPDTGLPGQTPTQEPTTDANLLLPDTLAPAVNPSQPQTNILGKAQPPQQPFPQQPFSVSPASSLGGIPGLNSIGGGSMSDRTAKGQQQTTTGGQQQTTTGGQQQTTTGGQQQATQAPGPMPAGGAAIWEMYLNSVFGSPGQGQPSYLAQSLAEQQQWLDEQNQQYVDAIQQNVQPYNQAIDVAKANPVNISFGGQPVGNVMMQGGMNAEQRRMGANMLAPAAQWDYAQQNTPSTAYLQYANVLAKAAMDMQKMAYGIPSSNVANQGYTNMANQGYTNMANQGYTNVEGQTEGPEAPLSSQVGNWLNIAGAGLGALQTGMNIYDFGKNQNWWGG